VELGFDEEHAKAEAERCDLELKLAKSLAIQVEEIS
jgi:hypothetical protein